MASCAPLVQDGEGGNVTISLPGGSGGRAVVPSDTLLGRIAYTFTLTGPGGTRTQTLAPGQTQAVFTLAPGVWTVSVTALVGGASIASGGAEVAVTGQSGQRVSIDLDFYDEADFDANSTIREVFTVTDLADWNAALAGISGTTGNYIINVTGEVTGITGGSSESFPGFTGTVSIQGGGALALGSAGNLLDIRANQKVVLRDVTLTGIPANTASLVNVNGYSGSASLTMKTGAKISGNFFTSDNGGGVSVTGNASFTMEDGEISGNSAPSYGGGVCIGGSGINGNFSKTGGIIYGDTNTTHTPGSTENTVTDVTYGNFGGHAVAYCFYNNSSWLDYYRGATLNAGDNISTEDELPVNPGESLNNWIKSPQ